MTNMSSSMPSSVSHTVPAAAFESKLSEQLSQQLSQEQQQQQQQQQQQEEEKDEQQEQEKSAEDSATTTITRNTGNRLLESPRIKSGAEGSRSAAAESSKDDSSLSSVPATPQRPSLNPHSLSLDFTPTISNGAASSSSNRTPLSPILDSSQTHGSRFSSPGSVLPRRSRGLDFSRACTNLHLSTLAESSPESSPTIGGRGVAIPPRRGSMGSTSAVHPFSTSGPNDRTTVSSSVSSVNMMESDTSSSEEEDGGGGEEDESMGGDKDDMILSTPQANKMGGSVANPFAVGNVPSPGTEWMGGYSHAAASLMSFQRARFSSKGRSRTRQSSSSTSGKSSKPSPGPLSPPVMKSIENPNPNGGGYFTGSRNGTQPRRESLSMGAGDLRLSDFSDDGEGRSRSPARGTHSEGGSGGGPLGVIRRAVTRRGNLLPKTKTFARIRAALVEESAPLHSEAKREAEVIRQVRDSEPSLPQKSPAEPLDRTEPAVDDTPTKQPGSAGLASRTSTEFWGLPDERYRTPPPSMRHSEDDLAMDMMAMTPSTSTTEFAKPYDRPSSRSSMRNNNNNNNAPHAHPTPVQEFKRKRAREEDFDPNLFKRRAVSPSMSVQSSPVMSTSSAATDAGSGPNPWGPPPKSNIGSLFPEASTRSSPHTQHSGGTFKRFGLQGMTETNDGLMNMSIE